MRKALVRLYIALLLTWASALVASAEQQPRLTARQQEIFSQIAPVDGVLTEELHREFWSYVPESIRNDANARAELQQQVSRILPEALQFQKETWLSIKMSAEGGKVIYSPDYQAAKQRVMNDEIETFREQAKQGAVSAEQMIQAAATKRSFSTKNGSIYLTPELAQTVLGGLDGSLARIEKLSNPVWISGRKEFRYPEAHVTLLSDVPFSVDRSSLTAENGRTAHVVSLMNESADGIAGVSFMDFGGQWSDADKAIMNTAKKAFAGTGAVPVSIAASTWRGRRSVLGTGPANTSQGTMYVSLRVVEDREHGGAHIIQAISFKSQIDAMVARELLESSVQFLP